MKKLTVADLTVKLLLLAVDWTMLLLLFDIRASSLSNWEIKNDAGDPSLALLRANIPKEDSVKTFKDYSGIVPLAYDLTIRAPINSNGVFRQIFEGSVVITLTCNRSTKYLYFNIKELSVNTSDVNLVDVNDMDAIVKVSKVRMIDSSQLAVELTEELVPMRIYNLTVGKFSGPIKGANSEGLFAGDAFYGENRQTKSLVFATQFQLNFAHTVFPCIDSPQFRSNLTLKLEHSGEYTSLSNMPANKVDRIQTAVISTNDDNNDGVSANNLFRTYFDTTPRLPTYNMAFVIFPKSVYDHVSKTNVKLAGDMTIVLSVYYNRFRVQPNQASLFLKYAEYAYCYFDRQWNVVLPLKKLDLVVIPQFLVQGMENFGLITLNEEFLLKSTDDTQFNLIAHEVAHQWLSNLVTIQSWAYLCFQESLTEHYARRVVRDFYQSQNNNLLWSKHLISRYIAAMKDETDDDSLTALIQSNFVSVTQVRWCFNRAPFVISGLELLAGIRTFDVKVSEFIHRYAYGSVVFEDFARYFDSISYDNRQLSQILRFYFEHGGYPCLFVNRSYGATKDATLIRRQIVNKKHGTFDSLNVSWPMPISCLSIKPTNSCNLKIYDDDVINLDLRDVDDSDWLVFNDEFKFFYRVNYDLQNWHLLSVELISNECRLDLLTQVQLINDYCFFKSLGFLQIIDDNVTKQNFNRAYLQLQNKTGINFEIYIGSDCINDK